MNQNNFIYQIIFFVSAFPFLLSGLEKPDSSCREYREMLQQKGLKLATQPLQESYFPHEVVSVAISLRNTTDRPLTIPDLDRTSGALIRTVGLETNPSPNFSPETELRGCSFPVTLLLPGESRDFVLGLTDIAEFEKSAIEPRKDIFLRLAERKMTKHSYRVMLGTVWLTGNYSVRDRELFSTLCVEKQLSFMDEEKFSALHPNRRGTKRIGRFCRMFTLVRDNGKVFLMSSGYDMPIEDYNSTVSMYFQRPAPPVDELGINIGAAIRVAELPSVPQLPKAGPDGIVPFNDFKLIFSEHPTWTMVDVAQQHAELQSKLQRALLKQ